MEQSPSSASQEIPWPSWNPKVHYCVHNPTSIPILSSHKINVVLCLL